MATNTTPITYYRRYLDDPPTIDSNTPQQISSILPIDPNVPYYRRYLNDPQPQS